MNKPDLDIIKSPEAERMRQMVTAGFYDRSRIGLWLFEVIGREWDDMAEWARTVRNEAFPQTCTWSIAIWEFVYGYEPDDSLPLDFRRRRILSHRLTAPPINPARIEAAMSALTGVPVSITDPVAPYTFRVSLNESELTAVNIDQMYRFLRQMKPSHLSFEAGSVIITDFYVEDYHAGAIAELYREFFYEEVEIDTDGADYYAGAIAEHIREYFIEDEAPIDTDATDYHAAAISEHTTEVFVEDGSPIPTETTDYSAVFMTEFTKEVHTEDG